MATPDQIAALIKAAAHSDQNVIDAVSKWVADQINHSVAPPKQEVRLRANILAPDAGDSPGSAYQLPEDGLIRYQELKQNIVPVSRTTLWKWMRDGKFPPTVKVGGNYVAWRAKDIREWLNSLSPSE